jgi:hypothetical protein
MNVTPARVRAILLPALLVAGLFGTSSVSAAEDTAAAPPAATVAGAGVLAARGDGNVRLAGGYLLTGSLDGGSIAIRGIDRWSTIRVTGWNSKMRLADGTIVYRFGDGTGHYWIAGRTLATTIESDAMRLLRPARPGDSRGRRQLLGQWSRPTSLDGSGCRGRLLMVEHARPSLTDLCQRA